MKDGGAEAIAAQEVQLPPGREPTGRARAAAVQDLTVAAATTASALGDAGDTTQNLPGACGVPGSMAARSSQNDLLHTLPHTTPDTTPFHVALVPSGWQFAASPDRPLLRSAAQAGLRLPSSCRNGTCRACCCRVVRGSVHYRMAWPGLSAEEKAEGWILPCVAYPGSDLEIEVPGATRTAD